MSWPRGSDTWRCPPPATPCTGPQQFEIVFAFGHRCVSLLLGCSASSISSHGIPLNVCVPGHLPMTTIQKSTRLAPKLHCSVGSIDQARWDHAAPSVWIADAAHALQRLDPGGFVGRAYPQTPGARRTEAHPGGLEVVDGGGDRPGTGCQAACVASSQ